MSEQLLSLLIVLLVLALVQISCKGRQPHNPPPLILAPRAPWLEPFQRGVCLRATDTNFFLNVNALD